MPDGNSHNLIQLNLDKDVKCQEIVRLPHGYQA